MVGGARCADMSYENHCHFFCLLQACKILLTLPVHYVMQSCKILLALPVPPSISSGEGVASTSSEDKSAEVKGYDLLIDSLICLMSVGADYSNQNKKLAERVLLATASHQCFSLAMGILGTLPPSHRVLGAMVDGTGLSLLVSKRVGGGGQ